MTGAMPGQMNDFKWTDTHVHGFVGEINGNGLVDGFRKAVDVEQRFSFLFSEPSFGEERGEALAGERESGIMMRDRLNIQSVASNFCIRKRFEFGEPAVMVNMCMRQ